MRKLHLARQQNRKSLCEKTGQAFSAQSLIFVQGKYLSTTGAASKKRGIPYTKQNQIRIWPALCRLPALRFVLREILPDGIPMPAFCGFSILNGLLRTFVNTAHALVAAFSPCRHLIYQGDGGCRAILNAQAASIAGACSIKWFGISGKLVEPKVGQIGLESRERPFLNAIYAFLL